jgi:hypothetical protein
LSSMLKIGSRERSNHGGQERKPTDCDLLREFSVSRESRPIGFQIDWETLPWGYVPHAQSVSFGDLTRGTERNSVSFVRLGGVGVLQ